MAGKKGQKRIKPNDESPRHYEYYQKQYPEWTEQQCIDACNYFKKTQNYQCIEFYQTHYPNLTLEEQEKMLKDRVSKKNSPQKIEYWRNKYPNESEEQIQQKYNLWKKEHNYQCIEYYQKHYPNLTGDEHLVLLNKKIKNAGKIISSKVSGELNGMHHSKTTELQRKKNSPKCIEFYENKYPDLSHKEHIKLLNIQIQKTNNRLTPEKRTTNTEYYISKGYTEKEAKLKLKERQRTFTLEKCIKQYGLELGTKKYNDRQSKWIKCLQKTFEIRRKNKVYQSLWAENIINEICTILQLKNPVLEKCIKYTKENTIKYYLYDFEYNNKIIEFNGDYWHCNPDIYDENFYNKTLNKYAKDIWERDNHKRYIAENNGYKYLIVWENDVNINNIINYLLD